MVRILGAVLLALTLAGCAAPADRAWWRTLAGLPEAPAQFRFAWQMSGDASLAPLQAFDDGHQTWLQYPSDQTLPAVFERTVSGDRLLRPRREGDFLVVPAVPERMVLRGGHLQAEIWRTDEEGSAAGQSPVAPRGLPVAMSPADPVPAAVPAAAAAEAHKGNAPIAASAPVPALAFVPPPPSPMPPPPVAPPLSVPPARKPVALPAASAPYEATPADGNIRRALGRWAQVSGWTFDSEHWAVDVDIPLAGSAAFGPEFVPAVRELLAATELGDRPLQPCFYANRVLRVVPFAQRCDRTQVAGASS